MASDQLTRIGVDLDGVVDDLGAAIAGMVKEKFGLDINVIAQNRKKTEYHLEDWPEIKGLSGGPEYVSKIFNDPELYRQAVLIDGAREVLHKWDGDGKDVRILTARPPHLEEVTRNWLSDHGFGWLVKGDRVIFNSVGNDYRPVDKPRLVNKLRLQVFIEDNADTLNNSTSPCLKLKILFDRPWNLEKNIDSRTIRVQDWREIEAVVRSMS